MPKINLHLALTSGDDSVAGNKLGHDTTGGLDTERKRVDVDEDDITEGLVTGEDTSLDSSAVRDGLIRVDALRWLLSEVLLQELLNLGDTSRTTNKDNLCKDISKI